MVNLITNSPFSWGPSGGPPRTTAGGQLLEKKNKVNNLSIRVGFLRFLDILIISIIATAVSFAI